MKNVSKIQRRAGFTLIELLVVISIMGVLAALTFPVIQAVKQKQKLQLARAELSDIAARVENYHVKYGVYPPGNAGNCMLSQLYSELSGTTNNGTAYVTLDGASQILIGDVNTAYGVGGFINCSKSGGEDAPAARNFLVGLSPRLIYYPVTNNGIPTTMLVTSVGGPDQSYQPLNAPGLNPFRYANPGTNNPNSYDLWVDLQINGKINRINNWSR